MDNGTFLSCWYARCWYARSAAVSGRPRCARYSLCRRSLTGGSHTHPTLAVAWAVFAANGRRTARALRAPSCARNAACGRQRHITPRHASPPRQKLRRVRPLLPRQARLRAHRSRRAPAPAPQPAPRLPAPPRSPPRSHSFRTLPQRFGELAVPVAQSSRWALAAPSARFAPHLRVALGLRPKCPQGTRFPPVPQNPVPQHKP